ncbi:MAG: hypothetical protein AABM66_08745 [Actinomycetota bacterium]
MTTATRSKDVLAQLKAVEKRWADAQAEASRLGTEHHQKVQRFRELHDERHRLIHREPSLVDHTGQPVKADNPVGQIDQAIADLGDPEDSQARSQHADELARVAKEEAHQFFAENFWSIMDCLRSDGERAQTAVDQRIAATAEAVDAYLHFVQRLQAYTVPMQGITTHLIPGLDQASALKRELENWTLPVPVPDTPEE